MTEQTDDRIERALDDLCRLDDEFGLTPEDVRWVRERAQTIRAALAAAGAGAAEVDREAQVEAVTAALYEATRDPQDIDVPDVARRLVEAGVHAVPTVTAKVCGECYQTITAEDMADPERHRWEGHGEEADEPRHMPACPQPTVTAEQRGPGATHPAHWERHGHPGEPCPPYGCYGGADYGREVTR